MEITGKVAIVTGAASGIGRASAVGLADAGAKVVVVDTDRTGGEETVAHVEARSGSATFVQADVATPNGIADMFAAAKHAYGGVDILHNNAALVAGGSPPWPHTPLEKILHVIDSNLSAVIMGTAMAVAEMSQRGVG